jgi:predicted nucleic acid-binding protein
VLVAAFWGDHRDHDSSLRVFAGCTCETAACAIHTLAEVYATMMALPVRPLLAPEQAMLFVEQLATRLTIISLSPERYLTTIRELADRGAGSGRVHDALLLACARKSGAGVIYTWNQKHFRQLAPDLADRIQTPE